MPTLITHVIGVLLAVLWTLAAAGFAGAQQPAQSAGQPVKQAAFDRSSPSPVPAQSVRFSRRESRVGDQMEQNVAVEMRLTLNMRRENELIGKQQTTVRTNQRRVITSAAVEGSRTMKVTVQYLEATKQVGGDEEPGTPADSLPAPESVQGKTYVCYREAGEGGKLIVTDEAGNRPPAEELEIVSQQMDMVGRPNPLADYLAGRSIAVGEKLELPNELGRPVFNLGKQMGEVTGFTLALQRVQPEGGANCAVFLASVDAASTDASQMRMQVEGQLVVQIDSCRTARVDLAGPIAMSETRGSYSTAYQVIGTGRLHTKIASAYREAKR